MSGDEGITAVAGAAAVEVGRQVRAAAGSMVGDVAAGRWRRAGLVGLTVGVVAAGAAAGVAVERMALGRDMRRRASIEVDAAATFGSLRGRPRTVPAPDGTELYVELDGTAWPAAPEAPGPTVGGSGADTGFGAATGPGTAPTLTDRAPTRGPARTRGGTRRGAAPSAAPDTTLPGQAPAPDRGAAPASGGTAPARGSARRDAASATASGTTPPGAAPAEPPASGGTAPTRGSGRRGAASGSGDATPDPAGPSAPGGTAPARGGARRGGGTGSAPGAASASGRKGWLGRLLPAAGGQGLGAGPLGGVLSGVGSWLGMAPTPPLTVVFCHGYCLNQDSWHFQRAAFREGLRLVFWDQRSHGRSERSRSHLAGQPAAIDQLGGDLKAVIDAVAPTGPLVLVGHSMGGMTVMALADQHPELFVERVAAVALIGTTFGSWSGVTLGLPSYGAKVLHRVAPGVLKALGRQRDLVERSRRLGSDLTSAVYRKFSFGTEDVDPAVERFAQRMLEATPIDVVAEFFPAFALHEKKTALAALRGIPTLVLGGTRDLLTPPEHSEAIAAELPDAELVIVQDAGHLVMLERPDLVNSRLALLLEQAARRSGAPLPQSVRDLAPAAAGDAVEPPTP
jgi:pimeloyl-ACP methyl ester carboxylesterase